MSYSKFTENCFWFLNWIPMIMKSVRPDQKSLKNSFEAKKETRQVQFLMPPLTEPVDKVL